MLQFKNMTNAIFETQFKSVVDRERRVTVEVLHHFREAERRMLYAERGRKSLREYALKDLKYSEPAADRRIAAMRAMKEMPELEEKIASGDLSLSTINEARTSIRRNEQVSGTRATAAKKKEILESIEGLSFSETKKALADSCPDAHAQIRETIRPTAGGTYKLETTLSDELHLLLEEIQDLVGRRMEVREIILEMAREKVKVLRKKRGVDSVRKNQAAEGRAKDKTNHNESTSEIGNEMRHKIRSDDLGFRANAELVATNCRLDVVENSSPLLAMSVDVSRLGESLDSESMKAPQSESLALSRADIFLGATNCSLDIEGNPVSAKKSSAAPANTQMEKSSTESGNSAPSRKRKYISVKLDRELRARSGNQCEYQDPDTGVRCCERRHLEREHIIPLSHGGDDSIENLQIYCSTHNKLKAAQQLGFDLMAGFMPSLH